MRLHCINKCRTGIIYTVHLQQCVPHRKQDVLHYDVSLTNWATNDDEELQIVLQMMTKSYKL